jgi:hypothetical protein
MKDYLFSAFLHFVKLSSFRPAQSLGTATDNALTLLLQCVSGTASILPLHAETLQVFNPLVLAAQLASVLPPGGAVV